MKENNNNNNFLISSILYKYLNFKPSLFLIFLLLLCINVKVMGHPFDEIGVGHLHSLEINDKSLKGKIELYYSYLVAFFEMKLIDIDGDGELSSQEMDSYIKSLWDTIKMGFKLKFNGKVLKLKFNGYNYELEQSDKIIPQKMKITFNYNAFFPEKVKEGDSIEFYENFLSERPAWRILLIKLKDDLDYDREKFINLNENEKFKVIKDESDYPDVNKIFLMRASKAPNIKKSIIYLKFRKENLIANVKKNNKGIKANLFSRENLLNIIKEGKGISLFALILAFILGGIHSLSPGHGKTLVAAYLIGKKGKFYDAILLALVVTITHTFSVFLFGIIALYTTEFILPEKVFLIMSIISSLMIIGIGLGLLRKRLLKLRGNKLNSDKNINYHHHHKNEHSHHFHAHLEEQIDELEHLRKHIPEGEKTFKQMLLLGISGGLVPCPSAMVVLLTAIALGKIVLGLILLVSFSLGLGSILSIVGLTVLYSKRLVLEHKKPKKIILYLPVISSILITLIGIIILINTLIYGFKFNF